jgi:hypothetical protein
MQFSLLSLLFVLLFGYCGFVEVIDRRLDTNNRTWQGVAWLGLQ